MGKRKPIEIQENNWLFSCPSHIPTEQIAAALRFNQQPILEFSAKHWGDLWQVGNEILRVYSSSADYHYTAKDKVSWDQLNDWIEGLNVSDNEGNSNLFIIREAREEIIENLAYFIGIIYKRIIHVIQKKPHLFPNVQIAMVLAGWPHPYFIGRGAQRISFAVNTLPDFQ